MQIDERAPVYASVDLELTGFDPETEEIIEVGVVLFQVVEGQFVYCERYASLVKPQKSHIRHRIAGLTGISAAELTEAPLWDAVATVVRPMLKGVILVGHGVELDLRFLKAVGIDDFVGVIDTLELAQVFLPTYHSYNLESLGNLFSVGHEGVHRAGGDAEATVGVLRGCIGIYQQLPTAIQQELSHIAQFSGQVWPELFSQVHEVSPAPVVQPHGSDELVLLPGDVPSRSEVLVAGLGRGVPDAARLMTAVPAWIVAFFDREQVFQYARTFSEVEPYVGAFEYLSEPRLDEIREQYQSLSRKEHIALQKVLVWKHLFSRFGLLSEINWSIIGTEVKKGYTSGFGARFPRGLAAVDFRSFSDCTERRPLWVQSLEDLYEWHAQRSGYAISWQSVLAGLRQTLHTDAGGNQFAKTTEVEYLIAAVDTYFVSTLLLLKRSIYRVSGAVSQEEVGSYAWNKIAQGAFGLAQKLEGSSVFKENTFFQKQVSVLKRFFAHVEPSALVLWIEFSDKNISFNTKPLSLAEAHQQFVGRASRVVYQTGLVDESALRYIRSRIGLPTESMKMQHSLTTTQVRTVLEQTDDPLRSLNESIGLSESLLVLFKDVETLREYYDTVYPSHAGQVAVLAVGIHGGAHKILRNFNKSNRTIVLAAVGALQGYVGEAAQFTQVVYVQMQNERLHVHPYTAAVAQHIGLEVSVLELLHEKIALARALATLSLPHIQLVRVIQRAESGERGPGTLFEFVQQHLSTLSS